MREKTRNHKVRYLKKILLLLVVLFIIICGCSKENERPDDVREEIWVNGKAIYQIFDKFSCVLVHC